MRGGEVVTWLPPAREMRPRQRPRPAAGPVRRGYLESLGVLLAIHSMHVVIAISACIVGARGYDVGMTTDDASDQAVTAAPLTPAFFSQPDPSHPHPPTPSELQLAGPHNPQDLWPNARSAASLATYAAALRDFVTRGGFPDVPSARAFLLARSGPQAATVAERYRDAMEAAGLSPATVAVRLSALRSMLENDRRKGRIDWVLDVRSKPAEAFRDTRGPGVEVVRRMLEHAATPAALARRTGWRDAALFRLLVVLALRREEVCSLRLEDAELSADPGVPSRVAVLGKGRAAREWRTIPAAAAELLRGWIARRGPEPGPLFPTLPRGAEIPIPAGARVGRMCGEDVRRVVADLAAAAGVAVPVRPHGLRHTAITAVLDGCGGDVRQAARFSRHRDIATVIRYDDQREDVAGQLAAMWERTLTADEDFFGAA